MNPSVLPTTLVAAALSAVSFSALASIYMPPVDPPDQVVASFDRLLKHRSTPLAVTSTATANAGIDPLRASVNVVLWQQPSYHLPATYAAVSAKPLLRS